MMFALPTVASAVTVTQWKASMMSYINQYRANHGKKRLAPAPRLQTAAQAHSNNMARYRLFSHNSANGTSWATRIRYYGYRGRYIGENLAVGQISPRMTLNMWVRSWAHRANLLNGAYDHVGIGLTKGTFSGRWAWYVTADFGGY